MPHNKSGRGAAAPRRAAAPGELTTPRKSTTPPGGWHGTTPSARRALPAEGPTSQEMSLGGVLAWTFLGTMIPGVGLIKAGKRALGGTVLVATVLALAGLVFFARDRQRLFTIAVDPQQLMLLMGGLIVVAIIFALLIGGTYVALRPSSSRLGFRFAGSLTVGILVFTITAPLAVAARYSYDQANLVDKVFGDTKSQTRPTYIPGAAGEDPWANIPRLNVLLVGGDYGEGRPEDGYGENTDTMILASIDTKTGNTVLVGVPRNTARIPFPKKSPLNKYFPTGYWDGVSGDDADSWANGIWSNLPTKVPKNVLGETDNLGADALKLGIGEALGVTIDYYVYLNLDGLYTLIDTLGGITVNINNPIPIAGGATLQPGPNQTLTAREAMGYARSRTGSDDFQRMARQRCVINAIIDRANPTTMLTQYEAIARTGGKIVKTDLPQNMLPMMVELSLRVKAGTISSMQFTNGINGFISADPNYPLMRQQVAQAIAASVAAPASASPSAAPQPSDTASAAPTVASSSAAPTSAAPTPTAAGSSSSSKSTKAVGPSNPAANLDDACAYDPPESTATASPSSNSSASPSASKR